MTKLRVISGALILIALTFVLALAQNGGSRGITPEDYFAFEFISDPNISPDGKLVAYVVTKIDRSQNRRNSAIWIAATDGGRAPWQFTTSPEINHFAVERLQTSGRSLHRRSQRQERTQADESQREPLEANSIC